MVKRGTCPVCLALVESEDDIKEAEIFTCPNYRSILFVGKVQNDCFELEEAPQIGEDWME